ncbi:MAG: hypothetical protein IT340_18515 [Chloroflexi bacterium]|nr:hypothetical protein [Chloroflexota bacterium]
MRDPAVTTAVGAWGPLIDWGGALIARGARLAVADGRLVVTGPAWLLTPPIRDALDRHERDLAGLLLRADDPAVAWRLAGMLADLARRPGTWSPTACPATPVGSGRCRSCGDALPAPRGPSGRIRCPACAAALRLALRRTREGDLG